jgi:acetone carboxylase gamma subunit
VHALLPLTEQEERVQEVLLQYRVAYLTHAVFPIGNRSYVVDFFLSDHRTVIECWSSASRRGIALCWIEKNAAYIDLKFRRIKAVYPDLCFVALAEVAHGKPSLVREYAAPALEHADVLCCSMEEFSAALRAICAVGGVVG